MTAHPPRVTHPLLDLSGIERGFFTRQGGVSGFPYESLNVGLGSKDDQAAVLENRKRVAGTFGQSPDRLISLYQIHSNIAATVDKPWDTDARPEADGLITTTQGLIVSALSADCAPLLFADAENKVVGACHAGWKGALYGIIESTIDGLIAQGAKRENIRCVVGPCIAQASYEVSADYETTFLANDKDAGAYFKPGKSADKRYFDLPGFCLMRLRRYGLTQVAATGDDTCADAERFFSNRRAFLNGEPDYGRLISAIMLKA